MNKVISVLGAASAALLLGSFLADGAPQDIMRLVGLALLMVYGVYKTKR